MEQKEVLAKGVNFIFTRQFVEKNYGREAWDKLMKALPKEARPVWDQSLLAAHSYSFAAFKAMSAVLPQVLGVQKEAELSKIYEYIADQSLNTIYKIFFRLMHPAFVIKNYGSLWSRFFNAGAVEVPVAEKGHAVLKFVLPEIFVDWLPPACLGFSRKAVEMSGGKGLSQQELSRQRQDDKAWVIVYELRWKE